MAIYNFFTLLTTAGTAAARTVAFAATDTLFFDANIDASSIVITTAGSNITVKMINNQTNIIAGAAASPATTVAPAYGYFLNGSTPTSSSVGTTPTTSTNVVTLTGISIDKLSSSAFQFDNGSILITGDGTSANTADAGNNLLVGTDYNDYLNGLNGTGDTVTYAGVQLGGVKVDLTAGVAGTLGGGGIPQDTNSSGVDTLLNIESLIGTNFADVLKGDNNPNTIDGGAGIDSLSGGGGNDTLIVTAGDSVDGGGGTDTIQSHTDFSLAVANVINVENLTLLADAINGSATGNTVSNILQGNTGNNILDGGLNTATVATSAGSLGSSTSFYATTAGLSSNVGDSLVGGDGNDVYLVRSINDVVVETNTVTTQVDTILDYVTGAVLTAAQGATPGTIAANGYTMPANVENARLLGTGTGVAVNITGNALNNLIYANNVANAIDGGAGSDTVSYQYKANSGVIITLQNDSVAGSGGDLLVNIENVIGTNYGDKITGDMSSNVINGGRGADTLDGGVSTGAGGGGFDTLIGGKGDDVYMVDSNTDVITEAPGEGNDTIIGVGVSVDISSTAYSNIENATLQNSAIAGLNLVGGSTNNVLTGNLSANALVGNAGDDTLYDADVSLPTATLVSTAANAANTALTAIIGTLTSPTTAMIQTAVNTPSAGNAANAALVLASPAIAAAINPTTPYTAGAAASVLTSAVATALATVATPAAAQTTAMTTAALATNTDNLSGGLGNDTYYVNNVGDQINEAASSGTDTVYANVSYSVGTVSSLTGAALTTTSTTTPNASTGAVANPLALGVENLTLTGTANTNAIGNALPNIITGNSGNNSIDGGAGADTMSGGAGNDTYYVDNTGDKVNEATLVGGTVDAGGTDTVISSVSYTLGSFVENLTLTGTANLTATGNASNNTILGNDGNNTITGGTGADAMNGGKGNDIYYVDATGDTVTESVANGSGGGIDLVYSSVNFTLGANVDNLTLTMATGSTTVGGVTGVGNALANLITGNALDNTLTDLSGATGSTPETNIADTLIGGMGNDTYNVHSATDIVVEASGGGTDTVNSSVSYDLSMMSIIGSQTAATANGIGIENLVLTGTAANATGNSNANTLTGNASDNILIGGTGADTLIGNGGSDTYGVDSSLDVVVNPSTVDAGTDTIVSSVTYALNDDTSATVGLGFGGGGVDNLTLGVLTLSSGAAVINTSAITAINATGNSQNNLLIGNAGNNSLSGGAGADTLDGGAGKDTLTGGDGIDVFRFTNATDTGALKTTADVITDFKADSTLSNDQIDLNAINGTSTAFTLPSTLNSTTASPLTAFTNFTANNQLETVFDGNDTVIYGNTDGNIATAEFAILLLGYQGGLTLGASDILS